ncbi:MAG: hypothetical protein IPG69_21325 [Flavobacteriales bacterium]|nr:hypothetical protein [Flavobacteriales bacterium]
MRQPAMLGKARAFFAKGDPANAEPLLKGVLKTEKRNGEVLARMTGIRPPPVGEKRRGRQASRGRR